MAENDIYQLTIEGVAFSNQIVNQFGFIQTSPTGGFLGQTLIDAWQAGCQTQYLATMHSSYTMNIIRASDVVPGTSATVEETTTTGNVGTGSTASGASQVAMLISWRTARSGKSYRGRTYLGNTPTNFYGPGGGLFVAGDTVAGNFRTAMITTFGPGSTGPFRLAIVSRFAGKAERPTPIATLVTTGVVRQVVATQRRRRLGVGA